MNTNNTFDTDSTDFTANLNSRDEDYIPSNAKPDTVQDAPESMAQEEHNAHSNSILQTSGLIMGIEHSTGNDMKRKAQEYKREKKKWAILTLPPL